MRLPIAGLVVGTLLLLPLPDSAASSASNDQDAPTRSDRADEPLESDIQEEAKVRLVLVDTVVIDEHDRTVPDLTAADFEVISRGRVLEVDTLDLDCPGGALDEPKPVRNPEKRGEAPVPGEGRRIVLAFDYLHLNPMQRELALDQARGMIRAGGSAGDEVLVAALTGGLRIEQTFTDDRDDVIRSLRRMQHDVTLWNGNFFHLNELGFVDGLTMLFDVLGTVPGPKAVLLFSGMQDVPLDLQFQKLAATAAASRCSIYAVDAAGLRTPESGWGGASTAPGAG